MDCFAALAMTERHGLLHGACHRARVRATRWLATTGRAALLRHCEERSDEAIHLSFRGGMDCFAALAMTERHGLLRGACQRARVCATRWLAMTGRVTPSLRGAK